MAIITLTEGVRQGDLEYMVSQFISVDQYSTKINNDNIVVSFFVKEQDAASDMGDFLSKNFFDIINDIEVSDSPTCNGDYQVFLEMERNKYFPEKLCKIIKILELLTGEQDWCFKTFKTKRSLPLTKENLIKSVDLRIEDETEEAKDDIIDVPMFGKIKHFRVKRISKYRFEQAIISSEDFNEAPTTEYTEISRNFPQYEVALIDGEIYLLKGEEYFHLIEIHEDEDENDALKQFGIEENDKAGRNP